MLARPLIEVHLSDDHQTAEVTVTHPRRIMNAEGTFELTGYKFAIATEMEGRYLDEVQTTFGDDKPSRTLTLPLQDRDRSGQLMVAAKYGHRKLVFSEPYTVNNLPFSGKYASYSAQLNVY
jgi:hypothetical protein